MANAQVKTRYSLLVNSVIIAIGGFIPIETQAGLPASAQLDFIPGQIVCLIGGTPPNNCIHNVRDVTGSYFAMDTNGDGFIPGNEKTPITAKNGILLGDVQPAFGSHPGPPGTGSTLENPDIDNPWLFFSNTGMHQTTAAPLIANGDDGTGDGRAEIDFSGWSVTWAGIPDIPMSGGIQDCGTTSDGICTDSSGNDIGGTFDNGTGLAAVTCPLNCDVNESYTLEYTAFVARADPSGFGGVFYKLHLEGTIDTSGPTLPTKGVSIDLTGPNAQECTSFGGNEIQATANIFTTDINDVVSIQWTLDGTHAGSGEAVNVFASLGDHTLDVVVDTQVSGSFQNSETVTIQDKTPPDFAIRFIDQNTGQEITEVSGHNTEYVVVRYDVTDACDPEAMAIGSAVPVHAVDDGDMMKIKKGKLSTVRLNTSAVRVSATARDATGNQRQERSTLMVIGGGSDDDD